MVTPNGGDATVNSRPQSPEMTPPGWVGESNCHRGRRSRAAHLSAEIETERDGVILAEQRGLFIYFFFFNWLQLIMAKEKTHTQFVLYSSSCACESNLLHRDNRKSEATVRSLFPPLFIISSLFTCLSSSSSFSHRSRPGSEGFNFPPARKRHCNYTSCFTELAGDNSLYAYRSGPPIKTHPGSPIISSRPGDLLLTSVHLFICRLPSRSRAFSGPPLPLPSAGQHVWLEAGDSIYRRRVSPLRRSRAGLPARLQNPAIKLSTRSQSWVQVRLLHYPRR